MAACAACGLPPQPFRDERTRDEWGRQHAAGTGHVVRTSREGQIVHISVGNSDDKLPQGMWSAFLVQVREALQASIDHSGDGAGGAWVGAWYSESGAPWQNACWCVEYYDEVAAAIAQARLIRLATTYGQDAIAWTYGVTVMLPPLPVPVAAGDGETTRATLVDPPPDPQPPLVSRSCPACRSIGPPHFGCTHLWHIEVRRPAPRATDGGDRFGYPAGWTNSAFRSTAEPKGTTP
jgi:hypothetical protein